MRDLLVTIRYRTSLRAYAYPVESAAGRTRPDRPPKGAMEYLAGNAIPARRDVGRMGHEFRPVLRGRGTRATVPVRRGRRRAHRDAGRADRSRRLRVARLPARHHAGTALRLPRARAVRSPARTALRRLQTAARSLRQIGRGRRQLGRVAVRLPVRQSEETEHLR